MSRRPRYRLDQRALFWWLLVGMSADEVVSALLMRTLVDDTRTLGAAVVFFAVFATIGAVVVAVGERVLPVEHAVLPPAQRDDSPIPPQSGRVTP